MSRTVRTYTPEQRAQAVARASVIGPKVAARELGIPYRSVARWHSSPSPELAAVRLEAARSLIDEYAELETLALARVRETLPTAPAHHAARALEVIAEHRALLAGEATARTESANLHVNVSTYEAALERMDPVAFRALMVEIAEYGGRSPVDSVIAVLRRLTDEQRAELEDRIAEADRPLGVQEDPALRRGIYASLPDSPPMYFSEDDPRWRTGELTRRFDWELGPSGDPTDG